MKKEKPKCETVLPWLKANLDNRCLAPLTGTDARALAAAVQIVELYAYDPSSAVAQAFGRVVSRMQRKCQPLAYHCIAHVMDWTDRFSLWQKAGLEPLTNTGVCKFEPGGQNRPLPGVFQCEQCGGPGRKHMRLCADCDAAGRVTTERPAGSRDWADMTAHNQKEAAALRGSETFAAAMQ